MNIYALYRILYHSCFFDFVLWTLFIVLIIGLPNMKMKNNLQVKHFNKLIEEIFHQFFSRSNKDPPVPYRTPERIYLKVEREMGR